MKKRYIYDSLNDKAKEHFDWYHWVEDIRSDYYNSGIKEFCIDSAYTESGREVYIKYDRLPRYPKSVVEKLAKHLI